MKKIFKVLAIIALVAVIGFSFAACGDGSGGGNSSHTHQFGTEWKKDATQHWHECSCGEKTDIADHQFGNWTETKAPSVEEEGEQERTCTVCGEKETHPIAKHVHQFGTDWEKDTTQHWRECSCGEKTDISNHQWGDWIQTKASTLTEEGEKERTCTACGEKETQTVAFIEMVQVAGGTFQMGKDLGTAATGDVAPLHQVTLTDFKIGKYEVTQEQYQAVMGKTIVELQTLATTLTTNNGRGNNYPVYYVSWYNAIEFCNELSVKEGLSPYYTIDKSQQDQNNTSTDDTLKWTVTLNAGANGYRLPTEAQWEYAAKGGNPSAAGWVGYTYSGSDTIDDVAWYSGNNGSSGTSTYGTKAVGTKAPNGLGLYDMSGNVQEWCWDWYVSYKDEKQTDPMGAVSGAYRVARGGSWSFAEANARSVGRSGANPNDAYGNLGFRLVRP
jgi:formylglycine-generating enzyme required for sulfatase activity